MKTPVRHYRVIPGRLLSLFLATLILFTLSGARAGNTDRKLDSLSLARKDIRAVRTTVAPRIDGIMNDLVWQSAPAAGDFVEYAPRSATLPALPSAIRFAYDDLALYIFAVMYDPQPDSICRELGRRDQIESLNTDYISFDILPYNDGLNMYEFKVSPANLQNDCKYSATGQDISWDAVWESATAITDTAWTVEVKIPWSALRFPRTDEQVWGINMWRNIHRYHEYSTWSWVDNQSQDIFRYYGTLSGIRSVKPPVRLSFSPYISGYADKIPEVGNWSYIFRGGLDLRYGINESYTLDMMLIPDFGQVQSDDKVLNLTPFEIRYDEKRQFFTEATELFNKCEIFYTRRVGSTPRDFFKAYDTRENEKVTRNPDQTRIINATKISGRNSKGLAFGFFNAMTTQTRATLQDTLTGDSRKVVTQPFTNYNVMVVDQNLKNNSYVTLINTNLWIPDHGYSANVTGMETTLKNRKNTFQVFGRFNLSQKYLRHGKPDLGHQYTVALSKPGGKFQYQVLRQETGNTYDPNDMGFLQYNNETYNRLRLSWYDYDPKGKVINSQSDLQVLYLTRYRPYEFKTLEANVGSMITFVKYWTTYFYAAIQPSGYNDFYEPREWGRVYKMPLNYTFSWNFASDARKPFRYHHNMGFLNSPENRNFSFWFGLTPRVRFSDRLSVTLDMQYQKDLNSFGWVGTDAGTEPISTIYFGRRDLQTVSNVLNAKYIFSTKASLSLRARHYWSQARYFSFYTLEDHGSLAPSDFSGDMNINFNIFTADLQFVWYFAPGSEMSLMWKNVISQVGKDMEVNYFNDLALTMSSPQANSFSIRVLYYLDYLYLKKAFSKKEQRSS